MNENTGLLQEASSRAMQNMRFITRTNNYINLFAERKCEF